MRIIFAGTPVFAAHILKSLISESHNTFHDVVAVYTQPDRQAGRGRKVQFSAVKQVALDADITVEQPVNFKEASAIEQLESYQADLMIVVAYGLLLPKSVLETPKFGCINIHASILPRWRGAAPIQRAIQANDAQTGVAIMQMDEGLDTGDVLHEVRIDIEDDETGGSLHDRLAESGVEAITHVLENYHACYQNRQVQPEEGVTYAHKLSKAEANVDWTQPASMIACQIRAFNPWPVSYSYLESKVIRIWQAQQINQTHNQAEGTILAVNSADNCGDTASFDVACGDNSVLRITHIQMPNKKMMVFKDVLNGYSKYFVEGLIFDRQALPQ